MKNLSACNSGRLSIQKCRSACVLLACVQYNAMRCNTVLLCVDRCASACVPIPSCSSSFSFHVPCIPPHPQSPCFEALSMQQRGFAPLIAPPKTPGNARKDQPSEKSFRPGDYHHMQPKKIIKWCVVQRSQKETKKSSSERRVVLFRCRPLDRWMREIVNACVRSGYRQVR